MLVERVLRRGYQVQSGDDICFHILNDLAPLVCQSGHCGGTQVVTVRVSSKALITAVSWHHPVSSWKTEFTRHCLQESHEVWSDWNVLIDNKCVDLKSTF
eukprot:GFUD01010272.1.p1 GENE.GFUD01010272.1~~GFUD01010272.1.p1  ORF type:complete len:100 (+),score=5.73 GFUD01010272.1:870-1169(+)